MVYECVEVSKVSIRWSLAGTERGAKGLASRVFVAVGHYFVGQHCA